MIRVWGSCLGGRCYYAKRSTRSQIDPEQERTDGWYKSTYQCRSRSRSSDFPLCQGWLMRTVSPLEVNILPVFGRRNCLKHYFGIRKHLWVLRPIVPGFLFQIWSDRDRRGSCRNCPQGRPIESLTILPTITISILVLALSSEPPTGTQMSWSYRKERFLPCVIQHYQLNAVAFGIVADDSKRLRCLLNTNTIK